MNPTLIRIANSAHPGLALAAFTRFRRLVATGIMTEEAVLSSLVASANVPENEALETINRAFDAARRGKSSTQRVSDALTQTETTTHAADSKPLHRHSPPRLRISLVP
jgi:hypothetical protein